MTFNWAPTIRCDIHNGKAFLIRQDMERKKCDGNCSDCSEFLGVNISQIGNEYFDGCCIRSFSGKGSA